MRQLISNVCAACLVVLVASPLGLSHTATITDAQTSGSGTALTILICWRPGETAPTAANTGATAVEVDWPDADDPLGSDDHGAPVGDQYTDPQGNLCQSFVFVFPNRDCELGDEEFSATVTISGHNIPANGAGGAPYSENLC